MVQSNESLIGWTAVIGGILGVVGFVALLLLFVIGEPFGTLNDLLSIPTGFLLLPLVYGMLRLNQTGNPALSWVAFAAGVLGFLVTATGSILLVMGRISFERSLIPGIGGFGLIGLFVLLNSTMALRHDTLPRLTAWIGLLLAIAPTLALLAVLRADSIAGGLQAMAGQTAAGLQLSPWMIAFMVAGFVSYAGIPFWFIWVGRLFLTGKVGVAFSPAMA